MIYYTAPTFARVISSNIIMETNKMKCYMLDYSSSKSPDILRLIPMEKHWGDQRLVV